jgi:hypothetical protein
VVRFADLKLGVIARRPQPLAAHDGFRRVVRSVRSRVGSRALSNQMVATSKT